MKLGNGVFSRIIKQKLFKRNRRRILEALGYGNHENEFFLVSYPKSGNTWLRVILANYLKNSDEEIALHNVGLYVPDSNHGEQLRVAMEKNSIFSQLPTKVLKSHDPYIPFYRNKKVVYITRDGRDAINSYLYYLGARSSVQPSAKQLIKGIGSMPIGNWANHVMNWYRKPVQKKLIIRYEDMLEDASREIQKIIRFLDLEVDEERLKVSLEASSFENLKKLENKHGYYKDQRTESGKKIPFVRSGQVGESGKNFSEEDMKSFWATSEKAMKVLGYK